MAQEETHNPLTQQYIQGLKTRIATIENMCDEAMTLINELERGFLKADKKPRRDLPRRIAPALAAFMGLSEPKSTRGDVLRFISNYVRSNNLQLDDKRKFYVNRDLAPLFNIPEGQTTSFLLINKHITHLFLK